MTGIEGLDRYIVLVSNYYIYERGITTLVRVGMVPTNTTLAMFCRVKGVLFFYSPVH